MTLRGSAGAAGLALLLAATAAVTLACGGGASAPRAAAELTNPRLSPEHSQWLVGAAGRMATAEEVQAFLRLADDAAATAFEESFWERRDPDTTRPGNPVRELFERRATEADRRFSEAGYRGRRTARGTYYVLYGEPEKIDFAVNPRAGEPPLEVWTYPREAAAGLDGRRPAASYRFVKQGDLTVLYQRPVVERARGVRDLP